MAATETTATESRRVKSKEEISVETARQLGPEYIAYRQGGGGSSVGYLEGHRAIMLANEVFGYDGWNSEIIDRKVERITEKPVCVVCSVVMRVTLSDGSFHEDVGYGVAQGGSIPQGLEKAGKEAITDALKRVLRNFGESLGNCIYDKGFMTQVKAIPNRPIELDVDNLRRPKRKLSASNTDNAATEKVAKVEKGKTRPDAKATVAPVQDDSNRAVVSANNEKEAKLSIKNPISEALPLSARPVAHVPDHLPPLSSSPP